jgi:metal-responsive CopG/Arc/MetJ family transcriptional regulator
MADNDIPAILRPAAKNSKEGWPTISGQIPPDVLRRLDQVCVRRPAFRSDLIREAIELLLEREAA